MSVDLLVNHIVALPESDRAELLDRLDGLYGGGDDAPVEISEDLRRVLEERDAAFEADPSKLRTWDQLMEKLDAGK
jgi:hypothetical protein